MGPVFRGLHGIKGKLQHLHTGVTGIIPQIQNLLGQEAQILRDEVQIRQVLLQGIYKHHARALNPLTAPGVFIAVGNGPVGLKAPEVVQPHHVKELSGCRQAVNPPLVAGFLHHIPAVERVAPKLAVGGKGIGGTACHGSGGQLFIQLEQLGILPHLHRIVGNIDGHISDELDAVFLRFLP